MSHLIHHTWVKLTGTGKLKHARCSRCNCEKYFYDRIGKLIYTDRHGNFYYRTPSCVLPNTKL